jgi:uncharacterized protein YdeI (YjbR/CyaY-like superfamily)
MTNKNPKVDAYLVKSKKWRKEFGKLRTILLDSGLTEELKWGKPCYMFEKNNIAILQGFKDTCALMFFKGALLKDTKRILEKPGENSQAARRIPFTSVEQVAKLETALKAYTKEAIKAEKTGLEVKLKNITEHEIPEEFQKKLKQNAALKTAFRALTPGRQRAYLMYFSSAKQSKTRESRIEKCMPKIIKGKGLND